MEEGGRRRRLRSDPSTAVSHAGNTLRRVGQRATSSGRKSHGYYGRRWQQARSLALARARHRCERCGARQVLVVHHRDELGMTGPRAYDPRNHLVVCRRCHRLAHGVLPPRN